jgi:hypothetical protein
MSRHPEHSQEPDPGPSPVAELLASRRGDPVSLPKPPFVPDPAAVRPRSQASFAQEGDSASAARADSDSPQVGRRGEDAVAFLHDTSSSDPLAASLLIPVWIGDIICALVEIEADLPAMTIWPDLLRIAAKIIELGYSPPALSAVRGSGLQAATAVEPSAFPLGDLVRCEVDGADPLTAHLAPTHPLSREDRDEVILAGMAAIAATRRAVPPLSQASFARERGTGGEDAVAGVPDNPVPQPSSFPLSADAHLLSKFLLAADFNFSATGALGWTEDRRADALSELLLAVAKA